METWSHIHVVYCYGFFRTTLTATICHPLLKQLLISVAREPLCDLVRLVLLNFLWRFRFQFGFCWSDDFIHVVHMMEANWDYLVNFVINGWSVCTGYLSNVTKRWVHWNYVHCFQCQFWLWLCPAGLGWKMGESLLNFISTKIPVNKLAWRSCCHCASVGEEHLLLVCGWASMTHDKFRDPSLFSLPPRASATSFLAYVSSTIPSAKLTWCSFRVNEQPPFSSVLSAQPSSQPLIAIFESAQLGLDLFSRCSYRVQFTAFEQFSG